MSNLELIDRIESLAQYAGSLTHEVHTLVSCSKRGESERVLQLLPGLFERLRAQEPVDTATTVPPLPLMRTEADLPTALPVLVLMLERAASFATIDTTNSRRAAARTISDTQISAVKPAAQPMVFGAQGSVAALPNVSAAPSAVSSEADTIEATHVRAPNAMTPPSAIPDAPPQKNLALIVVLFLVASGMAIGLILLKGGTVSRGTTQASMQALDALYAARREPAPPGPCRKPEEFDHLIAAKNDFTVLATERRPTPEAAYLAAHAHFEARQERLPALDLALSCEGFAAAHNLAGRAAFKAQNLDLAATEYQRAIDQSPGFAKAHFNFSLLKLAQQAPGPALEQAELALKADPTLADAWFAKGLAYEALSEPTQANQAFCTGAEMGFAQAAARCTH